MTISQAIKLAIENGWKIPSRWSSFTVEWLSDNKDALGWFFLDPKFWEALGRGLGWEGTTYIQIGSKINENAPDWKHQMHLFIGHLAIGGSPEKFFEGL